MTSKFPPLPREAIDAVARGDTLEAIRRVRAATGAGLQEAKLAVDAWRGSGSHATGGDTDDSHLPPELANPLARGELAEATRQVREAYAGNIDGARARLQALRGRSPVAAARVPTVVDGRDSLGSWLGWLLAGSLLALAVYWWLG